MELILSSILLGFAGFDPLGAMIIMTAFSAGAKKKSVYLFSLVALASTVLFGTVFAILTNSGIDYFFNILDYIPDVAYAIIELALTILLFVWFVKRTFFKVVEVNDNSQRESRFASFARKNLPLAGLLFFLWAMTDPAFWTVIALCAKENNIFLTITCCGIWMVIGQLPLYVLTVDCAFGMHEKVVEQANRFLDKNNRREEIKKTVYIMISLLIVCIGIYFAIDSVYYLANGVWL